MDFSRPDLFAGSSFCDLTDCRGKLPLFYQLTVPAVLGLKQGVEKQKVKFPRAVGGLITND